ncbi:peptide-methionine (S)-S-oxide reductase MsrA [Salipiger sp. P9]|uniref:peptide-methionine (S)-S-oxide reductase MsrA n=1 Tax=Salipiger pentaromativorans TaxID=2943193 RepID=UPI0021570DA4|nr:peptide-methionine (S)-S-oxide reductase MsrA [Salipiger pentaromativorans]MCR8549554.1 peptide-methionine (S)-S-oxide reductase MsrA [Salipiger pentaromativorans]
MIRSVLLSVLILIGLAVQSHRAEAGERRDIVVAGGCFWCVEADFEKVPGVISAVSGYTGGSVKNPGYKQVSRGGTGHYEAVKITYDSARVSRDQLYAMFFRSVDPTDAGGQFCDRGDSYRTAIFVSDPAEKAAADSAKAEAQAALGQKIVTPILQADTFWKAEDYHQNYYKGDNIVLTRFGPIKQSKAYKRYRDACGRDQRVRQLWGSAAPFAGG